MKFNTTEDMRSYYSNFGGFSGGWSVLLENFRTEGSWGQKIGVSQPVFTGSWITKQFEGVGHEVILGAGISVVVIDNWELLEKRVLSEALRNRLLVMVTGNLMTKEYERARSIAGARGIMVRRSLVGVPVDAAYWYPTEEQLENGLEGTTILPLP
ncbi:MAG: hypothetical protein Q7K35_04175 [bacterium]|nr:hypothetical protein [bacterium]